ncbi:signal peptidase I [Cellulomonas sp. P22]|uniref:signal peptidase I n=1 Tax=Cellulomonas sp. P22 TaxID=3373189 RepID=UPI0037BB9255
MPTPWGERDLSARWHQVGVGPRLSETTDAGRGARTERAPGWFRAVTAALWTVVAVCSLAYATSLGVPLWFSLHHQRVLVVTSGSMSGARSGGFDAGDAVVMRHITDPSQLKVGQVVSFWPPGSDHLVTHRIVSLHYMPVMRQDEVTGRMVESVDGSGSATTRPYVVTKGDANAEPDPDATPLSRVRGVVLGVYPRWGWVLEWTGSATGRLVMLAPPLASLAAMELMALLRDRSARRTAATDPAPAGHTGARTADDALLLD